MTFAIPYSFIAGEKARSAEVNANFAYLMNALSNIADTTTIDLSASTNKLSSIGVKDVNSGNPVKMWTGLQEEYDAITTKDPMTVYYLTDTGSVFLGETAVGSAGGSRVMGEIVTSTVPLSDAGLHLLDGSLIPGDGVYADFVNYMKDLYNNTVNANFFTTEANWQAAISVKGVCGKFVYDSTNNTVRLPKVTGIIEGAADATTLGNTVNAGLPNITGRFQGSGENANDAVGAFYKYGLGWKVYNSGDRDNIYAFDASRDAAVATQARGIYRDDCYTVQPQTVKVLYYIVLASSVSSVSQINTNRIVSDLNTKANKDLSNIDASSTAKDTIVGWIMPDYDNVIKINGGTTSYTAPCHGLFLFNYDASGSDPTINGKTVWIRGNDENNEGSVTLLLSKNDKITIPIGETSIPHSFIPLKGAIR